MCPIHSLSFGFTTPHPSTKHMKLFFTSPVPFPLSLFFDIFSLLRFSAKSKQYWSIQIFLLTLKESFSYWFTLSTDKIYPIIFSAQGRSIALQPTKLSETTAPCCRLSLRALTDDWLSGRIISLTQLFHALLARDTRALFEDSLTAIQFIDPFPCNFSSFLYSIGFYRRPIGIESVRQTIVGVIS